VTWDRTMVWVKDAEDRATLAEREAQERVLGMEVESAAMLASVHEETEGLLQKIPLLEGELVKVRRAREVVEENACSFSDVVVDAKRWWEESERGCREQLEELTLL
jgi:predicted DNA-binding antitoxin AbrB/MazE fold protein